MTLLYESVNHMVYQAENQQEFDAKIESAKKDGFNCNYPIMTPDEFPAVFSIVRH